ncbi:hypothetical protein ACE34T_002258 [Vibrio alginolyticus]|uniref:hypothetical protein n=1 Tax=Vibrio diabolicus TaxID=50719 RepID=UPI0015F45EC4|nr:hypothetical protein [Vibrio diabolicus]
MQEELLYLINAKAQILGVSPSAIKAALAMECLLDEEAADDPISLFRDTSINDIR